MSIVRCDRCNEYVDSDHADIEIWEPEIICATCWENIEAYEVQELWEKDKAEVRRLKAWMTFMASIGSENALKALRGEEVPTKKEKRA